MPSITENPRADKTRKTTRPRRPKRPRAPGPASPMLPDLIYYPYTDTGNGERLVTAFGDFIRYCAEWKKWLVWDGARWRVDQSGMIRRWAKQVIRGFYAQAAGIIDNGDRENAEKHARRSESALAMKAMLTCAETEATVSAAELDRDLWLLNCRNGTVDLRTGELRPHNRADLITKLCPVNFDPNATCPQFEKFLTRILPGLTDYIQRVLGYALTGDVSEKACFCLFGEGNNGKTTLLELFRYMLGDYSAQVMIDTLMVRRSGESNTSLADLADLRGARFVTTSETEEGQKLAEGKLKYLTGMNEIKAVRKYEHWFTFAPTHKLFLDANHRPLVRGSETAIWNRLKLIPFTVSIPDNEIDKDLLRKLKAEAPGVLAWAVKGCLAWQQDGLSEPQQIRDSVETWKSEDDPYQEFFEDECEFDPAHSVPVSKLWSKFESWASGNGIRYASRTKLYKRLELRGCSQDRLRDATGRQVRCWKGIKVL